MRPPGERRYFLITALVVVVSGVVIANLANRPRRWKADEIPVAFWSWRTQVPTSAEVGAASRLVSATHLFLYAGQLDEDNGIKVTHRLHEDTPAGIELHLVYNATR